MQNLKSNSTEVLISKTLIDSNINHDRFVLINNVLNEYDDTKEEIKNLNTYTVYWGFMSIYKTMFLYYLKCRKNTESINPKVIRTKKQKNNAFIKMCIVWQ